MPAGRRCSCVADPLRFTVIDVAPLATTLSSVVDGVSGPALTTPLKGLGTTASAIPRDREQVYLRVKMLHLTEAGRYANRERILRQRTETTILQISPDYQQRIINLHD